jgi:aminopeptidase N
MPAHRRRKTTASGTATAVVAPEAAEPEPEITERERYQESRERKFDLIHTKLNVSFNYDKMTLDGKAELTLKPYFYNTNTLVLDAKGFDIRVVGLKGKGNMAALPYTYDGQQMTITLDKDLQQQGHAAHMGGLYRQAGRTESRGK